MNCDQALAKMPDFLADQLPEDQHTGLHAHVVTCPQCGPELESLRLVWRELGHWPEAKPSPAMRDRFFQMLDAYDSGRDAAPRQAKTSHHWWWALVAAAAILTLGFVLGRKAPVLSNLKNETGDHLLVRQEASPQTGMQPVGLTLLTDNSPSERLQAVHDTQTTPELDNDMLKALLLTLNQDPNVNVRLAAVDVLYQYLDHPNVRAGLVRALPNQASPLVQVALVDCLVAIGEPRATESLRDLLRNPELNPAVRAKAQAGMSYLQ